MIPSQARRWPQSLCSRAHGSWPVGRVREDGIGQRHVGRCDGRHDGRQGCQEDEGHVLARWHGGAGGIVARAQQQPGHPAALPWRPWMLSSRSCSCRRGSSRHSHTVRCFRHRWHRRRLVWRLHGPASLPLADWHGRLDGPPDLATSPRRSDHCRPCSHVSSGSHRGSREVPGGAAERVGVVVRADGTEQEGEEELRAQQIFHP